jgi:hypothetical protein
VEGKHTTQARVISHVDDREIITVNAALGRRESPYSAQWTKLPDVPPPEDCDVAEHWRGSGEGLHTRLEVRIAQGRYGKDREGNPAADGRTVLWARPRGDYVIDATMLAIMADLVPSGIGNALGFGSRTSKHFLSFLLCLHRNFFSILFCFFLHFLSLFFYFKNLLNMFLVHPGFTSISTLVFDFYNCKG